MALVLSGPGRWALSLSMAGACAGCWLLVPDLKDSAQGVAAAGGIAGSGAKSGGSAGLAGFAANGSGATASGGATSGGGSGGGQPGGSSGGGVGGTGGLDYFSEVAKDNPLAVWHLDEPLGASVPIEAVGNLPCMYEDDVQIGQPGVTATFGLSAKPLKQVQAARGTIRTKNSQVLAFLDKTPFSVEAWIDADSTIDLDKVQIIVAKNAVNGTRNGWQLHLNDRRPAVIRWFNDSPEQALTTAEVTYGVHHLVATYSGTELCIYLDGGLSTAKKGCVPSSNNIQPTTNSFRIGYTSGGFLGRIDEVAVYGTALKPERVAAHYLAATQ